jgi:sugar transferase (PEP-CTERM system associated)
MIRLFRVFVPTSVFVLVISEFILLLSCYVVTSYFVFTFDANIWLLDDGGLLRLIVAVVSILISLHLLDLYTYIRTTSKIALVLELGQAVGLTFLIQALLAYVDRDWMVPRTLMIEGSAVAIVCVLVWRQLYDVLFLRGFGSQRVLFLGRNPVVQEISEFLKEHPEIGLQNIGYVEDEQQPGALVDGARVLGRVKDLRAVVDEAKPDRIVVGMSERRARMPMQDLLELRFAGIVIEEAATTYETARGRICTKELRPGQLIFSGELGPQSSSITMQSLYAPVIALIGTVVTLPIMLLTAIAIKVSSPGPILYRQKRVGRNDAPFMLYKFRSMYVDAEARTGAVWASKDDPRITPVGKWLRMLRIDELPQFLNVLRGEMAIVGPRPERPEFVKVLSEKIPYYRQRHCVKPGITGWAQINHKYGDTIEDTITKLEYDLYYIKHISPGLDTYIIFQTLKTMLRLRGAQ